MKTSLTDINILVVDDDRNILNVIKMRLEAEGYGVKMADRGETALEQATCSVFDLALVDLKLGEESGIDLMEGLHQLNPDMPIIILTAYGTIRTAIEAIQKGAYQYITKPFDYHELLLQIHNGLEKCRLLKEVRRLKDLVKERYGFDNVIGNSEKMKKVMKQLSLAAKTDSSVYIEGESGTGKELIARTLHVAGMRRDKPFVAINCAAIPEKLFESEMFGYRKGAFTGASQNRKGFMAQANGGSLFLDEISEMPLTMQVKLLRVLQEREFYPLGSSNSEAVDFRLITTSNRDLRAEADEERFRPDLFYRIHVINIHLPPLRERREDIPLLAKIFLKESSEKGNKPVEGISFGAIQKLVQYHWPGNVRQLKNVIEYAVAMTDKTVITEDLILQPEQLAFEKVAPLKDATAEFEKSYLFRLMALTQGDLNKAAEAADTSIVKLNDLLTKYGLKPEDP